MEQTPTTLLCENPGDKAIHVGFSQRNYQANNPFFVASTTKTYDKDCF